ncbi:MAG TPA: hypothetical protein VMF30_16900 [Pirellulales bacterium]|nr:hypothetical protein [Pirellulales bacterium]
MKSGDLTAGPAKLYSAWHKLRLRWEETQTQWHDAVSRDFDENYLARLDPYIRSTQEAMRALAEQASAAQQECDPDRLSL